MPLRSPNDAVTPMQVMTALVAVMTPNTALSAEGGTTLIDDRDALYAQTATFPALLLEEGPQSAAKIYWRMWQAKLTVLCTYYDRWDQQANTIDAVWARIDTDLRRMKANLEDNASLSVSGTRYALDVAMVTLSPFRGSVNDKDYPIPIVERMMSVQVNLQPYVTGS